MAKRRVRKELARFRMVAFLAGLAIAGNALAGIPEVNLAAQPLSGSVNIHPNVLLSLSIDRSASRAAYLEGSEQYDRSHVYQGYFNPEKCYGYRGGNRNVIDGHFYILRAADAMHECTQSFSGNFMNWAATSLLDIVRYALTGGDRVVDTMQSTVLQRAVLSDHSYADPQYFPRKVLKAGGHASAPNRVTPFNVNVLFIVSCRNRILFSDVQATANDCDTPAHGSDGGLARTDKSLGEYLARVQVCDGQEGQARTDLCRAHGKHYKPEGVMQRHAGEMRFAVMSYLLDDSEKRYGGVLRSTMRHIGQTQVLPPGFLARENPAGEWDPDTGILHGNPVTKSANEQTDIAGAINYVNRFGRAGKYRRFDPIGELYYEGLRYLQGKAPTPAALDDIQDAMTDGFPLAASASDPVTASCQRNYMISLGDAHTHWDRYIPGNQRTAIHGAQPAHDPARPVEPAVAGKSPALDVKPWTAKVGEMEADLQDRYANPAPRPHLADLAQLDTGEDGHGSYYMAGLAYWATTQDIRHDKPIRPRTLVVDLDDRGNGRLDGGQRAVKPQDSQLFLAAKYGGFRDANMDGNPFVTYAADGKTLARLSTAEWSGEHADLPETYLLGGDPRRVIEGLRKMFAMLANDGTDNFPDHARHALVVQSAQAGQAGAALYQAGFSRARWSGSLKKFSVDVDSNGDALRSAAPLWDAGTLLSGTRETPPLPGPSERRIYTSSKQPGKPHRTTEFKWDALDAAQRADFNTAPGSGKNDGLGERRVEYLRGERGLEIGRPGGLFRFRSSVLGDIANSTPVYAGTPASVSRDVDYPAFHAKYEGRAKAVYVGANDGMLHAFDAGSGRELFAYVPNMLLSRLSQLSHPEYLHRPFADGDIAVGDAKVAGKWRTVLAAGVGGGAQGIFALDVSDPARFDQGLGAIWEFTDVDDPDIGNIMGAPQIAKFRLKTSGSAADYAYFVVIPSGINNYKADGTGRFSRNGQSALFLLSLDKEPGSPWKLGANYYKIRLPVGEAAMQNGLSRPVLAGGADGAVQHAYAGDLQGNLWRFDFKDGAPWSKALGMSPKPLFIARDATGQRQPITTQPKLVYAGSNAYMVLFGTGKFLEESDAAPGGFRPQSFYGLRDTPDVRSNIDGRSALSPRILSASGQYSEAVMVQPSKGGAPSTSPALDAGWYFDFPESEKTGERVVSSPVTAFGRLFFTTLLPAPTPCDRDGGRMYVLDTLTGLPVSGSAMGYMLAPGAIGGPLLLPETMEATGPHAGSRRKAKKRYSLLDPNGKDTNAATPQHPSARGEVTMQTGRLSWREITNWQELRDEALGK